MDIFRIEHYGSGTHQNSPFHFPKREKREQLGIENNARVKKGSSEEDLMKEKEKDQKKAKNNNRIKKNRSRK